MATVSNRRPLLKTVVDISRPIAISGTVRVPGDDSYSNKAILIAALADGESRVYNASVGDDTDTLVKGLQAFGADITEESVPERPGVWRIVGTGGRLKPGPKIVDAKLADMALKLLISVAALGDPGVTVTGDDRLTKRPIGPLLDALRQSGAILFSTGEQGVQAPVTTGNRERKIGGHIKVDSTKLSQFLSSIMLVAPYFDEQLSISHFGLAELPYVNLARSLMERHGVRVQITDDGMAIPVGGKYQPLDEEVPPDSSSAAHIFTLALATGGEATVLDLEKSSDQPDYAMLDVFAKFGATVTKLPDGSVHVVGPKVLNPVSVDLAAIPDQLPNIAVLAALGKGITRIKGIAATRFTESDRIAAVTAELWRAGIVVKEETDELVIQGGGTRQPATFWAYDDHRIAMALTAFASSIGGCQIAGADSVSRSYRDFWSDAAELGLPWG